MSFKLNPLSGQFDIVSTSGGGGGGVSTLNSLSGALTLTGAGGITITPSGSSLIIDGSGIGPFANTALSNLASTAVNADIIPATNTVINLGAVNHQYNAVWTSRILANGGSQINVSSETIVDSGSGGAVIDWGNKQLIDNTGHATIHWALETLNDQSGAVKLDWSGVGTLDASTNRIINVVDPTSTQDAATKNYVDTHAANTSLSNLSSVAINTDLLPGSIDQLIFSRGGTNSGTTAAAIGAVDKLAGKLTPSSTLTFNQIAITGGVQVMSTTGSIVATIFADSAGAPGAPIVSSISQNANAPPFTSFLIQTFLFNFASNVTLNSGTPYWIGLSETGMDGQVNIYYNSISSPFGDTFVNTGGVWSDSGNPSIAYDLRLVRNVALGTSGQSFDNIFVKSITSVGGTIRFADGSEGTSGQVWTSTDTLGDGHWAAASANILALPSTATVGGAVQETVAVAGLLATDTILSVSQKTMGSATRTSQALIQWSNVANNAITLDWVADPGSGAVVVVAVKR